MISNEGASEAQRTLCDIVQSTKNPKKENIFRKFHEISCFLEFVIFSDNKNILDNKI